MSFKKTALVVSGAAGVSYLSYKAFTEQLFKRSFLKDEHKPKIDENHRQWFLNSNVLRVSIESFDGLKLSAYNIHNHDHNKYIIVVHGRWSNSMTMLRRAVEFDKLGYNLLLIDQRAAGLSEGQYHTYGFKESLDLTLWINYLTQKYADVQICLYGISMGAATVMLSTRYQLPDNVKCIVEDCGFSSVEEELKYVLEKDYGLAFTKIILKLLEKKTKEELGMDFDDLSVKKCLMNNEIPILFIHGMDDELVPYEMSKKLYNHNKGVKKFYPVPGAKHGEALIDKNYYNKIDNYIKDYFV